jgi:NAD(P)-dependent dehydrogenase (short-subunit alcohol dehydrogenase family)
MVTYNATKGAILTMTKCLAMDLGRDNIRVNCICPGGVETGIIAQFAPPPGADMNQIMRIAPIMGRMGKPDELASAFAYIASDEARYVNGSIFVVDGAMTT